MVKRFGWHALLAVTAAVVMVAGVPVASALDPPDVGPRVVGPFQVHGYEDEVVGVSVDAGEYMFAYRAFSTGGPDGRIKLWRDASMLSSGHIGVESYESVNAKTPGTYWIRFDGHGEFALLESFFDGSFRGGGWTSRVVAGSYGFVFPADSRTNSVAVDADAPVEMITVADEWMNKTWHAPAVQQDATFGHDTMGAIVLLRSAGPSNVTITLYHVALPPRFPAEGIPSVEGAALLATMGIVVALSRATGARRWTRVTHRERGKEGHRVQAR